MTDPVTPVDDFRNNIKVSSIVAFILGELLKTPLAKSSNGGDRRGKR